jgi:peptidoglycan-N-acetylglucosamine deacetylase
MQHSRFVMERSTQIFKRALGRYSRGDWLPVIRRMNDSNLVGLTFDDGPTPETTPELLKLLRDAQATASFFLTGVRAAAALDLVREIVAAGHDVYAHGWTHVRYDEQPRQRLFADLLRTEKILQRFRPTPQPYLVRLPYAAGLAESWVHRAVREWQPAAQFAHWHYGLRDWTLADGCRTPAEVEAACEQAVAGLLRRQRLPGSILLLHENPFDVEAPLKSLIVSKLMAHLLPRLRERGLQGSKVAPRPHHTWFRHYVRG